MSIIYPIKVVALDDHPVVIEGLQLLLNQDVKFELCATAHSWQALISTVKQELPDIVILDLNIRGKNILSEIKPFSIQFPKVKILIFSSYNTPSLVKKAFSKGINGYLLKDTTQQELLEALAVVAKDEIYIGKRVAISRKSKDSLPRFSELSDNFDLVYQLTARETQIIQLIAKGYESQKIADQLFISLHTVQSHRKNIMRKLDVHSAAEIARFAFENRIA